MFSCETFSSTINAIDYIKILYDNLNVSLCLGPLQLSELAIRFWARGWLVFPWEIDGCFSVQHNPMPVFPSCSRALASS